MLVSPVGVISGPELGAHPIGWLEHDVREEVLSQ